MTAASGAGIVVRIWDPATRLVHWLLVILLALSWYTAETGVMDWHRRSGYAILTLLLFRLFWGFAGSQTARFAGFLRGPATVLRYAATLRRRAGPVSIGHNPLGGWSVLALLGALAAMVGLGLFAVDVDGLESGPLSYLVDFDAGRRAAEWHATLFTVLQALVVVHVAAILFYRLYRRHDLVSPMITGRMRVGTDPGLRFGSARRALLGLLLSAAAVAAMLRWAAG